LRSRFDIRSIHHDQDGGARRVGSGRGAPDRRRPLVGEPGIKFAFQLLVALVAVVGFGFVIRYFGLPGSGGYGSTTVVDLGWFAIPVSLFWLLGMQNTVNFLDGVDGLAAGSCSSSP